MRAILAAPAPARSESFEPTLKASRKPPSSPCRVPPPKHPPRLAPTAASILEVAVPYQPGQPAIFVPAQIVFAEELPEQRLYRCGVQYLSPTKPRDSF